MKIKVLQYTGAMNRGGAETLLMNLYRNIDRSKFEFHFITHSKEKSDYDDEIIKLGGQVIYLEKPNLKDLKKFSNSFKSIVEKYGPYNAIHAHVQLFNGIVLREAKRNNIKIRVSHAHLNGDYENTNILRKLYRGYSKFLINKNSTNKIACSYKSGQYLYNSNKFVLLNNAIDINQFKFNEKSNYLKKELELNDSDKIITHIGTFKEAKNHDFIIDIFKELNSINNKYKLILVGRGELEEKIKMKVRDLGLSNKVYFLGVREDIPQILQSTDIFFMPSILEGLPVVLVEAQAAGVPCIISNNIPEKVDMGLGVIKRLNLKDSKEKWIESILNLRQNNVNFSSRKDKIIKNGFDLESNVKFLAKIYSQK